MRSFDYQLTDTLDPRGKYGVVWRGVKRRAEFSEHAVEGHEIIIFEVSSKRVLAIRRVFFQFFQVSNGFRQDPRFAYARACPKKWPSDGPQTFIESVLIPTSPK